ncbi:MAG: oligosaccharide flippase family protein, partial [Butyrivibrio sp.]
MTKLKNKWNSVPLTVKVSTAYTVCSILQRCLSFITLPVFTRILTQEQYGQYTIYSSWLGIFS